MIRNPKTLPLLFFFLFPGVWAKGQPAPYHLKTYTNENGLPTNSIKGMEYDTVLGTLWLGTEAGIFRFNGYEFKNYLQEPTRIFNTTRDSAGRICFIAENDDIYIVRNQHPVFLKKNKRIPPGTLARGKDLPYIYPDWILPLPSGPDEYLYQKDSTVFFDTDLRARPLLEHIGPCNFVPRQGYALICTDNVLFRFDYRTKRVVRITIHGLPNGDAARARFVTNINTPQPAIIIGRGLWMLSWSGDENINARLICNDLPKTNDIAYIRIVEDGNLIIAANRTKGLLVLRRESIRSVPLAHGPQPADYVVYGQAQLAPNTIVTNNGIIIDSAGKEVTIKGPNTVHNFYTLRGCIWYNHKDTLFSYTPASGRATTIPLQDGSDWVVLAETNGQLYAISDANIYELSRSGAKKILALSTAPIKPGVRSGHATVIELAPSVLAIAARNHLMLFHVKKHTLDTITITRHAAVRSLWKYGAYLFIGTYGNGIFCLKDGQLRPLPLDNNHYLLYTHCFVPDKQGYIWLSTNNGLFKARLSDMCAAWETKSRYLFYYYFGKKDGLKVTELNGGCQTCALQMDNGTLSFPSMEGLAWIKPDQALTLLPNGKILIDGITAGNRADEDMPVADPANLPQDTRSITIQFCLPYWGDLENLYAQYRLIGSDDDWMPIEAGNQKFLTFSNLRHGSYVFELRVFRGFGSGAFNIHRISFTILTPWYLSWWFRGIVIILSLLLLWLFVKWRLYSISRKNIHLEELIDERTSELAQKVQDMAHYHKDLVSNNVLKDRLISIISHNIITPLRYIHRAGTALRSEREKLSTNLQEKAADSITETSRELELLAVNMLNWIRFQHDNPDLKAEKFRIAEVIQKVLDIIRPIAREKLVTISCRNEYSREIFQFKDAIRVILYNLLLNAVNYSVEGTIIIHVTAHPNGFRITVTDEGIGMEQDQIDELLKKTPASNNHRELENKGQGLGYLIIKDLLRITNGNLYIESTPGTGTCASVVFTTSHDLSSNAT